MHELIFNFYWAEELRVLLPRGLDVLGVLLIIEEKQPKNITQAGDIALKLRGRLWPGTNTHRGAIAAVAQLGGKNEIVQYSWYDGSSSSNLQALGVEIFDDGAWNDITLLRCQMQLSMPLYFVSSVEAPGNFICHVTCCKCLLSIYTWGLRFRIYGWGLSITECKWAAFNVESVLLHTLQGLISLQCKFNM